MYAVDSISVEFTGMTSRVREATITAQISNRGGTAGSSPIPVEMWIDDQEPTTIHIIEHPSARETQFPVVSTIKLGPGAHEIWIAVGDSQRRVRVNVESTDLAIRLLPYVVVDPGSIVVPIEISNEGEIAAEDISIGGNWRAFPYFYRDAGPIADRIARIDPGQSRIVEYPIKVRPGAISVLATVWSLMLESRTDNNLVETILELEYPQLDITSALPSVVSYQPNGTAIVQIQIAVENNGLSAASGFKFAVLDWPNKPIPQAMLDSLQELIPCRNPRDVNCWRSAQQSQLARGDRILASLQLALAPGNHELQVVAARANDIRRLSPDDLAVVAVEVPSHPESSHSIESWAKVEGYWSDGTANIELTGTLSNLDEGETPVPSNVNLICTLDESQLGGCGGKVPVTASSDGKLGEFDAVLRIPMGQLLNVQVIADGIQGAATFAVEAPERILGVERSVWACFTDRETETKNLSPESYSTPETCGGWSYPVIRKWDSARPVRIWINTSSEQFDIAAKRAVGILAGLVNNTIDIVESESEANLVGNVGIPQSTAFDPSVFDVSRFIGCFLDGGCADAVPSGRGDIQSGTFVCWSDAFPPETAHDCAVHELLHIVAGNEHRDALDTVGGWQSVFDQKLIMLNGHRLVKPGMTLEQVREVVVFQDELLDPTVPTNYELLWNAGYVLRNAPSANFVVRGFGDRQTCPAPFGWDQYAISGVRDRPSPAVIKYSVANGIVWVTEEGMVMDSAGSVSETNLEALRSSTSWFPDSTNLVAVLRQILAYGDAGDFDRVVLPNGDIELATNALFGAFGTLRNVSFTIASAEGHIVSFHWQIPMNGGSCTYQIEGQSDGFGQELNPPLVTRSTL